MGRRYYPQVKNLEGFWGAAERGTFGSPGSFDCPQKAARYLRREYPGLSAQSSRAHSILTVRVVDQWGKVFWPEWAKEGT